MRKHLLLISLIIYAISASAQEDPEHIKNYYEEFYSNGVLMKKMAADDIVVMTSLEPAEHYGKLYKLYISVYNNTGRIVDVLDSSVSVRVTKDGNSSTCDILTYKEYSKRVKNRDIAQQVLIGDLDNIVFGRNPNVYRTETVKQRDNRGGGDDTLYMARQKTFRHESTTTTRINYVRANRYMMREIADNSDVANGIRGIMSDYYFRSNTLDDRNRFTSGYLTFKRKKNCDRIDVTVKIDGKDYPFVWTKDELDL